MKILHTSDWHVGMVLKGRDRYDEHAAALGSIVRIARAEDVDLVVVAGDLFDSAAPSAKSQGLVMRTLLALCAGGRHVVAIAGDHDDPALLDAVYRPGLGHPGLHVLGTPKRPSRGGMLTLRARAGETVNVAALPFLSSRDAVRAAELLPQDLAEHAVDYPSRIAAIVRILTRAFAPEAVNVVMTHAMVQGGLRGGERDAKNDPGYELAPDMFPPSAQYAALGHLHRQQEIPGPCPIFYSGSPLTTDFGDIQNAPCVLIISAEPGARAQTRGVPVAGGRPLLTLRGTLDQVIAEGAQAGDAYVRVVLAEPARSGLGDRVRDKLSNALEVVLDDEHQPRPRARGTQVTRIGRSPLEVFGDYLAEQSIVDPRLNEMFAELLDVVTGTDARDDDGADGRDDRGADGRDDGADGRDDGADGRDDGADGRGAPGQAGHPAGWNASPDDRTRPGETSPGDTSTSESRTADGSELLDEDDEDQEYVDAAGPQVVDPGAAPTAPPDESDAGDSPGAGLADAAAVSRDGPSAADSSDAEPTPAAAVPREA
jgi:DNA repair protein SbcD/Mre11